MTASYSGSLCRIGCGRAMMFRALWVDGKLICLFCYRWCSRLTFLARVVPPLGGAPLGCRMKLLGRYFDVIVRFVWFVARPLTIV